MPRVIEVLLSSVGEIRTFLTTDPVLCVVAVSEQSSEDCYWVRTNSCLNSNNLIVNLQVVTDVQVVISQVGNIDRCCSLT